VVYREGHDGSQEPRGDKKGTLRTHRLLFGRCVVGAYMGRPVERPAAMSTEHTRQISPCTRRHFCAAATLTAALGVWSERLRARPGANARDQAALSRGTWEKYPREFAACAACSQGERPRRWQGGEEARRRNRFRGIARRHLLAREPGRGICKQYLFCKRNISFSQVPAKTPKMRKCVQDTRR